MDNLTALGIFGLLLAIFLYFILVWAGWFKQPGWLENGVSLKEESPGFNPVTGDCDYFVPFDESRE